MKAGGQNFSKMAIMGGGGGGDGKFLPEMAEARNVVVVVVVGRGRWFYNGEMGIGLLA